MFKKRAPAKKKNDEDEDSITVSVPQDMEDIVVPAAATTTTTVTEASHQVSGRGVEGSIRNGPENRYVQPHQPWKPWDQDRTTNGRRMSQNSKIGTITPTQLASTTITASSLLTTTTSTATVATTATSKADSKSPGMMLNLSSMFSSNPSTPQQPQHVEAHLWNADIVLASPISPAVPRYIPAIAGNGANPRVHGSNSSGGASRLTSGWAVGATSMNRKSNDGSTGWRSLGQASPMAPSLSGLGSSDPGSRSRSPSISSSISSIITPPAISPPLNHHIGGLEKNQTKSAISFRASTASGYSNATDHIPQDSIQNGYLTSVNQELRNDSSTPSAIPTISNGSLSSRAVDGERRTSATYLGSAEGPGSGHDVYTNGKVAYNPPLMDADGSTYEYHDKNLEDRKKDRYQSHDHHRHDVRFSRYSQVLRDPKRVLRARLFCLRQNRRLHPGVRLIMMLLMAGSVFYTTFHLMFRESNSKGKIRRSFDYTEQQLKIRRILGQSGTVREKAVSSFDVEAQKYSIHQWALDTYDMNNSKAIARVSEDYMLSKAFSGAMQPTSVIPFYFKASFMDENDDDDLHEDDDDGLQGSSKNASDGDIAPILLDSSMVTITTLITPDRYGVFLKLVKQYRGPISVATHIRKGQDQDKLFHELNEFFKEHAILRKYVDLHVIVDDVDFQLNMWRNVARMFARTDYFMMLDVDFHIPSSLKNHLHHDPRIQELLSGGAALVVPAFEYSLEHDPKDSIYFPDTKADLIPLLEKEHIRVFHDSFPPGHAATDTPRWIKMSKRLDSGRGLPPKGRAGYEEDYDHLRVSGDNFDDDEVVEGVGRITEEEREEYLEQEADGERPYKVTAFEPKYEPYIVLKREGTPWCDERFVGYGANKAACLFEIYVSGIDFWVMPQDFLIHQYHDYPTTNRKNGRILNKQLFVQFQQEICFATLRRMIATGEWYTSKADNLRHQCGAFENFLGSADDLAQEFEDRHPNSLLEEPIFVADTDSNQKNLHQLRQGITKGTDEQNDSDRYEGHGYGKVALGEQIVDDEEHHDPFMSRPKGKMWGGIQPRKYYVPPPPIPGIDIPFDGIDIDSAITGALDADASSHSEEERGTHENDLTGEKLEQFRQGIILSGGLDNGDRFTHPRQSESENIGDETKAEEQTIDRKQGSMFDEDRPNDQYADEDSDDPDHNDDSGSPLREQEYSHNLAKNNPENGHGSFEDAAEKLEEKYRLLRAEVV